MISEIYDRSVLYFKKLSLIDSKNDYELELLQTIAGVIGLSKERFLLEVENGFIEKEYYRKLIQGISKYSFYSCRDYLFSDLSVLEKNNYHDLLYSDFSFSYLADSSTNILSFIENERNNPFHEYFKAYVLPSIIKADPKVLGISITALNQVIPSFTLLKMIKNFIPLCHTTIGGAWCTQIQVQLKNILNKFSFIDSVIIYEGEEPLYQLCVNIINDKSIKSVPNLVYRECGNVVFSKIIIQSQMNELPTPDYSDLIINNYDASESLSLQTSRGCYWGKCTFCSYPVLEPKYKIRSVEKVIGDILKLKEFYNAKSIQFTDALLSPHFCEMLSNKIIEANIQIEWLLFARLENKFTDEILNLMARAGCRHVSWGLESASSRILDLIDKNIDIKNAEMILNTAAGLHIHNRVLVMYGHPTESYTEALLTIDYIRKNINNIHSIAYGYYHPEKNTPIEAIAPKLNIKLKMKSDCDLSFEYIWDSLLTEEQKNIIEKCYLDLSKEIQCLHSSKKNLDNIRFKQYFKLDLSENDFKIDLPLIDGKKTDLISKIIENRRRYFLQKHF